MGLFIGSGVFLHVLDLPENLVRSQRLSEIFRMLGISCGEAVRYRSRLQKNAALILVNCKHEAHSEWARELLTAMGAEEASLLRSAYLDVNDYLDVNHLNAKKPAIN